jgi:hypothetical protein
MALVNECLPYYEDSGQPRLSVHAGDALTGKRIAKVKSNRQSGPGLTDSVDGSNYVATVCGAGELGYGVVSWDVADEAKVPLIIAPGTILPITAGGTVAAGDAVQSDATGRAITANGGAVVGLCLTGASVGEDLEVLWYGAAGGGIGGAAAEATAVTSPTATPADITGGQDPTEAEFNALLAVIATHKTAIDAIITALENRNIVAPN